MRTIHHCSLTVLFSAYPGEGEFCHLHPFCESVVTLHCLCFCTRSVLSAAFYPEVWRCADFLSKNSHSKCYILRRKGAIQTNPCQKSCKTGQNEWWLQLESLCCSSHLTSISKGCIPNLWISICSHFGCGFGVVTNQALFSKTHCR